MFGAFLLWKGNNHQDIGTNLWFLEDMLTLTCKSCPMLLEYSCWDISMCCSVVHCYIGPLLCSKKSTVLPTKPCRNKGGHEFCRQTECSIYQHHMMYNGTISCSSVRFKGRLAQLPILHSGGRDVWWIRKMLSYFGAVRCERRFTGRLVNKWVCVWAPVMEAFPGSALTIRTDEDVCSR